MKRLIAIVVLFGLINGGLWIYWTSVNADERKEYDELQAWFKDEASKLTELKSEAESAESDEEYNQIVDEYNALQDEYNSNVEDFNMDVKLLNDEFYLIPIPGRHSK
jgi:alpha-galactosidase/6-phospho-beta-glucosidase family protein